jgi:general secretion pathway protein D
MTGSRFLAAEILSYLIELIMKYITLFRSLAVLAVLLLCLPLLAATPAPVPSKTGPDRQQFVQINFPDIDINVLINLISEMTGKNFIVDPAVKGKVTIICPDKISVDDAYRVFESVLEVHGYATVPSGSVIKIVPAVQARSKSIPTVLKDEGSRADDKFVTRIIRLDYAEPEEIRKFIQPLISKTSMVLADANANLLVITDALANINRLLEIIKAVDVPSEDEELEIIPLKHASAASIGKSIGQLFTQARAARRRTSRTQTATVKIIPDERTNSLIVFAPREDIDKLRSLLAQLDVEVTTEGGNIHVYYLQHADAEELVKVLTSLPTKQSGKTDDSKVVRPNPADAAKKNEAAAQTEGEAASTASSVELSDDIKITADPETNTLIITSSKEEYRLLEKVIKQLDIPRRMVYLEALIMEVSIDKQFDIGAEWGGLGSFHDETGTLGTGFTDNSFGLINGIAQGTTGMAAGATFGILKKGVKIGGAYFPNLGTVVNAFQKDSDINIIATPQILTTDNKEASITVGENVPYITSKNTSTTGSTQDYTNYEYKDVGTTLKITPQINQANLLRLDIEVEVTRLKSEAGVATPTTYKRSAATSVVVHNEDIVVIGGMIGQDATSGDYKVPLLGDVPVLGWLFKTHESSKRKTNMFIFIAPRIVDSSPELADIYYKKRDKMEDVKEGGGKVPEDFLRHGRSQKHAYLLLDQGFAKLQNKEYKAAEKYFQQALKNTPENPYALINLAEAQEQQGESGQALEAYQQVLELADEEADALLLQTARARIRRLKWDAMKIGRRNSLESEKKKEVPKKMVEPLEKTAAQKAVEPVKEPAPGSDEAVLEEAKNVKAEKTGRP